MTLRHNRAFWIVVIGVLGGSVATTTLSKTVIYYFKYFLDAEESARYALTAKTGLAILIVATWVYVTRFIGKRHAWFVTTAWGCAGLVWFYVADVNTVLSATMFFVLMHVCSVGIHLTYWSMLPDTVEYGEWRTGVRAESLVFGFAIFCQKTALGLAAGLLGVALDFVGFVPNVAADAADVARHEDDHHPAAGRRYGDRRGCDVFLSATTGSAREDRRGACSAPRKSG